MVTDHVRLGVPGRVDHDRTLLGVAVGGVQAVQAHRAAVLADIIGAGGVVALGSRLRTRQVGEALQPAGMAGIGPTAMGDQQGLDLAGHDVDQVKPRNPRGLRKIGHAHHVGVRHPAPGAGQPGPRRRQRRGGHIRLGSERPARQRAQGQRGERRLKETAAGAGGRRQLA